MPPMLPTRSRASWIPFGILTMLFMLSFFHRVAPAAVADELQRSLGIGAAQLGTLAAAYFYVYFLMQVPTGILADTLGARRVVVVGALTAAAGSVVFALAQTWSMALAGRALVGLGVSVFFICMLKVAADTFGPRRFSTATGIGVFAGNMGAVLAAAPLAWLVDRGSWRFVFVGVGVALVLLSFAAWRSVAERAPVPQRTERDALPWPAALAGVLRTRAIWPAFGAMLTAGATYGTFIGLWAVPYLVQVHGMTASVAAGHTSAALGAFAVSAVALGHWADRIGRKRPFLIGGLAMFAFGWALLVSLPTLTQPQSYLLFVLLGATGTAFTLLWACAKDACPPQYAGMSTSVVNAAQFLGVGLLQPVFGWILDRGWTGAMHDGVRVYSADSYRVGIGLFLVCTLIGLACCVAMRERPPTSLPEEMRP